MPVPPPPQNDEHLGGTAIHKLQYICLHHCHHQDIVSPTPTHPLCACGGGVNIDNIRVHYESIILSGTVLREF